MPQTGSLFPPGVCFGGFVLFIETKHLFCFSGEAVKAAGGLECVRKFVEQHDPLKFESPFVWTTGATSANIHIQYKPLTRQFFFS
jgi:hypothetical protein